MHGSVEDVAVYDIATGPDATANPMYELTNPGSSGVYGEASAVPLASLGSAPSAVYASAPSDYAEPLTVPLAHDYEEPAITLTPAHLLASRAGEDADFL
jgi:hypothetical protein